MENNAEQIEINVPLIDKINVSDIKWKQQGYQLIGTMPNGMQFGTRIDSKLRLIGVDENNKPKFKRIDM
jgi:hypothetical protein